MNAQMLVAFVAISSSLFNLITLRGVNINCARQLLYCIRFANKKGIYLCVEILYVVLSNLLIGLILNRRVFFQLQVSPPFKQLIKKPTKEPAK